MFESAKLKIERAEKHVAQLDERIREGRPFRYMLETDHVAGYRSTFAERNDAIVNDIALIAGDAVHNLRSALDHAYWEVVSPLVNNDRERRAVQFPFSETQVQLRENIKNRFADRVSPEFSNLIIKLSPHGESGGNRLLYMIHQFDILDKHKLLIPTADYTRLTSHIIQQIVPDFPSGLDGAGFGKNRRDVGWPIPRMNRAMRRANKVKEVVEREIDVPVQIVFEIAGERIDSYPVSRTLHELVDIARAAIAEMDAL